MMFRNVLLYIYIILGNNFFFCLQFPITVNNYYWNNYNYIILFRIVKIVASEWDLNYNSRLIFKEIFCNILNETFSV